MLSDRPYDLSRQSGKDVSGLVGPAEAMTKVGVTESVELPEPADLTLSANPDTIRIARRGRSEISTITASSNIGLEDPVRVYVMDPPLGSSGAFDPPQIELPEGGSGSTEFRLYSMTNPLPVGLHTLTIWGVSGGTSGETNITLEVVSLDVSLSANPNPVETGEAVSLTAAVSGTAQGPTTYGFYCESDGTLDRVFMNEEATSKTWVDGCSYSEPGTYTAKVGVQRGMANPVEATTTLEIIEPPPAELTLTATPDVIRMPRQGLSGISRVTVTSSRELDSPVEMMTQGIPAGADDVFDPAQVDLSAGRSGTTNFWVNSVARPVPAGTYNIKVEGKSGNITGETDVTLEVVGLGVTLTADPSIGEAPLEDVNLIATVSGTAEGLINYGFDCDIDSGPLWDQIFVGESGTTKTWVDGCGYSEPGTYTARVRAERGIANPVETTIMIEVRATENLSVSLAANPSDGIAPLATTLTADVSGTASGTVNYTFWWDCDDSRISVEDVMEICGYIPTPNLGSCEENENGIKCDAVAGESKTVSHTYSAAGNYTAKVIAERGGAPPAEDRVPMAVEARDEWLAKKFAPIVFIHPDDVYRPNRVTVLLEDSQLKEHRRAWPDRVAVEDPTEETFERGQYLTANYFLDIENKSLSTTNHDPKPYRDYYLGYGSNYPILLYARVIDDQDGQQDQDGCTRCTVVQYWFFYYFNDWRNLHEGDWEMVQVILDHDRNDEPVLWAYSQHAPLLLLEPGGTRLAWKDLPFHTGDHPWVFVGSGSHASYFSPGTFPYLKWPNETAANGTVILPPGIRNPNIDEYEPEAQVWWSSTSGDLLPYMLEERSGDHTSWVDFEGTWGRDGWPPGNLGGKSPNGPQFQGNKWSRPLDWARQLPGDSEHWPETNLSLQAVVTSTIELHLYDAQNRHVGPNASGGIDLEIPGSSYQTDSTVPATAIRVSPASLGEDYQLELRSLGSGTFNLALGVPDPNAGATYASWHIDVPFGPRTIGRLLLDQQTARQQGTVPQQTGPNLTLELDHDGDGTFETQETPTLTSQNPLDTTPPRPITDLSVSTTPDSPNGVRLVWTAPADTEDEAGVVRYDIRYAPFPISSGIWEEATRATDVIVPKAPGEPEVYETTDIDLSRPLYFAVRSVDAGYNVSGLSNVVLLRASRFRAYLPLVQRHESR